ncbi:MAG: phosphoesterase [Persephonella sp.]|nr:MAG: phosphoesterase [Persephonella sp.]
MAGDKSKIVCIYHKNCTDGTFSASVLKIKYPDCKLYPLNHGYEEEDFENILNEVDKDTIVYITDFSLRDDDLKKLLSKAKEVINIDHHIGVKEKLEKYQKEFNNYKFIFDNNSSGASLTWKYLFGEENIPKIIKLVEDKDLWNWKYGDYTKFVNLYLYQYADKPEEVLDFIKKDNVEELVKNGEVIAKFVDYIINKFVENAEPTLLKIGDYKVKAFNVNNFQSEIGNILAEKYGEAVALFNIKGYQVRISFRSLDNQSPSALELAKILGGGGHKNASGASIPLEEFCNLINFNEEGEKDG